MLSRPVAPDKEFALAPVGDGTLVLTGVLTIATVTRILRESLGYFHEAVAAPGSINLSGVTSADSAGLALLIEWVRLGRKQNCHVKFVNMPVQMLPLARLFGVDHLLQ